MAWNVLACLFADDGVVAGEILGLPSVTLLGRQELDAAVAFLVKFPLRECRHPLAGGPLLMNVRLG